jgi:hypothetical protein
LKREKGLKKYSHDQIARLVTSPKNVLGKGETPIIGHS